MLRKKLMLPVFGAISPALVFAHPGEHADMTDVSFAMHHALVPAAFATLVAIGALLLRERRKKASNSRSLERPCD
jgi:hypothetical protein